MFLTDVFFKVYEQWCPHVLVSTAVEEQMACSSVYSDMCDFC
jgi:hypothetical protein